jgi:hypothetical protein
MKRFGATFCRVAIIFLGDLCSMPDSCSNGSFLSNLKMIWGPPGLPEIWCVLIHEQFVNLHIYPVRVTTYLWFTCTFSECGISWNARTGDMFCRSIVSWSSDHCTRHNLYFCLHFLWWNETCHSVFLHFQRKTGHRGSHIFIFSIHICLFHRPLLLAVCR